MRLRIGIFAIVLGLAVFVTVTISAQQAAQPKYQQGTQPAQSAGTAQKRSSTTAASGRYSYAPQFTEAERTTIRTCMTGTYGNTGVTARALSATAQSQVQINAQLSSGLQKRLQPLPGLCASRLTMSLPANWTRALLGRNVVLLDPNQRISDMFSLDGQ